MALRQQNVANNQKDPGQQTRPRAHAGRNHRRAALREVVSKAFIAAGKNPLRTTDIYEHAVRIGAVPASELETRVPVGRSGSPRSIRQRDIRWIQQTLKFEGLIERVPDRRGAWRTTRKGREELTPAVSGRLLVAFSTQLGLAVWADCATLADAVDEDIHLYLSSPPYALSAPRAYGNPTPGQFVDWLCKILEPVVRKLARGASICLNMGNDLFEPMLPSRHLINERLAIALNDRLGLSRMDTLVWENPNKAPGPLAWASKKRVQLNAGYEPLLWFCNSPADCFADNRRVLQPHSRAHALLQERSVVATNGGRGSGSGFRGKTAGAIPRNVLRFPTPCPRQRHLKGAAEAAGLPVHPATFPKTLARFLVEFLTAEGQLVVDGMSGTLQVAMAAEETGRRWVAGDIHGEYLGLGMLDFSGPSVSPAFLEWLEGRRAVPEVV
ncbi:site-specific DNA-methyltransferase (plasmid) [Flagellatimonas centrodinii]|uniref:site-specific DNA-methyltransferase n=1 Tax=Flagellatimonas centrodinii TaxID=2806210 RepID=UPI001FEEA98E|nr:site-specific DNA-methyltransferase [Flagellatimonas centrodinii]ULQ48454.1 site-specific DNA-methyltransferase [Flagellatimonas centrodinii]